ncbi:MAG: hypothetical protein WA908_01215, partial [Pontixanthobacter sp.]
MGQAPYLSLFRWAYRGRLRFAKAAPATIPTLGGDTGRRYWAAILNGGTGWLHWTARAPMHRCAAMRVSFVKMHGLGNDFVVLDGRADPLPELDADRVRRLADRHRGIGCDQLIALERSDNA